MKANITVHLPSIKARQKFLRYKMSNALQAVGGNTIVYLQGQWEKGVDGRGIQLPALSKEYKAYKEASGRAGIRNFFFKGRMYAGMVVKRLGAYAAEVTFQAREVDKALGQAAITPNFMYVSKKYEAEQVEYVAKRMKSDT